MGRSRTGTSLLTSIIAAHGVHLGRIQDANNWGYKNHEHAAMKDFLRSAYPGRKSGPIIEEKRPGDGIKEKLEALFPQDRRWVYKCGVRFFPVFDGLFPGQRFIFCKRSLFGACGSLLQKNPNDFHYIYERSKAYFDYIDEIAAERGIPVVDSEALVRGDRSDLRAGLEYLGLEYDAAATDSCIKPEMWDRWRNDPNVMRELKKWF